MRKIESAMVAAIASKTDWQKDNTSVLYCFKSNQSHVTLYGHHIASYSHALGAYLVNLKTLASYPTATTKSRLRAMGQNVTTKKGVTFLDGVAV